MISIKHIVFYLLLASDLILCADLWAGNEVIDKNISQCQASITDYQTQHQSLSIAHSRQARVSHLLNLLKHKPIDIAERLYVHYLSIKDPKSELKKSLANCLMRFFALPAPEDIKSIDLLRRLDLDPLQKLKDLDERETSLWSRFGVSEKEFDDAVGLAVEVVRPRPRPTPKPKPSQVVQTPVQPDVESLKQELRLACEVVRNIDSDQHYEDDKRSNTLNIIANLEKLLRALQTSDDKFNSLHKAVSIYTERKESDSFDWVKRAARDLCQEALKEPMGKTPGEILGELAYLGRNFKKQMVNMARLEFSELENLEEIKRAVGLKEEVDAHEKKLKAVINPKDIMALKSAHQEVQNFSSFLWRFDDPQAFLHKVADFKKLAKTNMKTLDDAIKSFSEAPSDASAKNIKREVHDIFKLIKDLHKKYQKAQQPYDASQQELYNKYDMALFNKDDADRKYNRVIRGVTSARPGTLKAAKQAALEFASQASKYDPNIDQKIKAIIEGL